MSERTFLIQRYSGENWPQVKGEVPFLATGPWFKSWSYGIEKFGEWRFVGELGQQFEDAYGTEDDPRFYAAWALLECGFVQALWADHSPIQDGDRWIESVLQLSREIPPGPIGAAVIEYLSGLSDPNHFRSYVAEDQIGLVSIECPTS